MNETLEEFYRRASRKVLRRRQCRLRRASIVYRQYKGPMPRPPEPMPDAVWITLCLAGMLVVLWWFTGVYEPAMVAVDW